MPTPIKPEDLRVGNLVTDEWHPDIPNIITVESINKKGINLEITDDGNWSELAQHFITPYHTFEQLRPIPLTEEWLLKFGFEVNQNHEHPSFDDYRLPEDSDFALGEFNSEYWIIDFLDQTYGSPEIHYVHQLQNLYYFLSGKELTFKDA